MSAGPQVSSTSLQEKPTTSFDAAYQSGMASLRAGLADKAVESLKEAVRLNTTNKQARCAFGQVLIGAGQPGAAIEQYKACVGLDPKDVQTYYDLGQAYLRLALDLASKVLQTDDTSPYARRIFAEDFVAKGDFSEAETQYGLALQAQPNEVDLHLGLATVYLHEDRMGKAREELERALDGVPGSVLARYKLAEVDFLQGNLPSALEQLRGIARLNPGFLSARSDTFLSAMPASIRKAGCGWFSKPASNMPEDPASSFLAEACHRKTDSLESVKPAVEPEGLNTLMAANPSGEVEKNRLKGGELCLAGYCETCGQQLERVPHDHVQAAGALLELGQCDYDTEDYDSAYRRFAAAEKSQPNSLTSVYWLQESARHLAEESFERLRQIDPDSYLIHLLTAQTWERLQKADLAAREYRAALARKPEAVNVRVLLGHLQWKWEKYDEALPELLEALRLDPAEPAANYLVGDIWVQKHEPQRALPYLNQALAVRPGLLNAEASLGRALGQLGRVNEAVKELELVAPADVDGSIHYELHQLYLKLGETEKARSALAVFEELRSKPHRAIDLP